MSFSPAGPQPGIHVGPDNTLYVLSFFCLLVVVGLRKINTMESSRILSRPIEHVDEMYAKAGFANSSSKDLKQLIDNVAREFRSSVANMLTQGEVAPSTKLPSLNALKSEELRDGMLVSFRGMVQDMFESEIFLADYPSAPTAGASPAQTRLCGLFRDATPSQARLDPLSGNCTLLDR